MTETSWHSYPKVFALGHAAVRDLLLEPVVIEEKLDGSQFSFGVFDGELKCRSKGQQLVVDSPERMFIQAVDTAKRLAPLLKNGWTYRGEYLQKPKHNALTYSRIPEGHIALFDINCGHESYLGPEAKAHEALRLGLEVVPVVFEGMLHRTDRLLDVLDRVSMLGGVKIEGLVVKNYTRFGEDKKVLMGKFVSEAFKEIHRKEWKESNPGSKDILDRLILTYRSPARWEKAFQHLRDAGKLEGSPRDIGALMREIPDDVFAECSGEIAEALMKWAGPHIKRGVAAGVPDWYKRKLLEKQFESAQDVPPVGSDLKPE